MENVTRRAFIGNTAAIAGAAVLGIEAARAVLEHGPVEIQMYFFTKDPVVIKGSVFSDERRDVFGVRAFVEPGKEPTMEVSLSAMRKAVEARPSRSTVTPLFVNEERENSQFPLAMTVENGKVSFLFENPGHEPSPVWLQLSDVQRVL